MQTKERNHLIQTVGSHLKLVGQERALPGRPSSTLDGTRTAPITASDDVVDRAWVNLLESAQAVSAARVVYGLVIKRWLDVAGSALLLVCLAPLLVVTALVIRLSSPGPILYRQERIGRNGEPFVIYKFRTMIPDRRERDKPFSGPERRRRHKTEGDPRVTRLGKFLRQASIDELPQLVNILRGEMSFIGPRPEMPKIVARYEDWQHQRHIVRPGLSGWWQVYGRSGRPMHENTELDIYYVLHQSFTMDLVIFLRTFRALFRRDGAF